MQICPIKIIPEKGGRTARPRARGRRKIPTRRRKLMTKVKKEAGEGHKEIIATKASWVKHPLALKHS